MNTNAWKRLKKPLFCLPLLGLAPVGYFLGFYLDGRGIIPENLGFMTSAASFFLVPWVISALFVKVLKTKLEIRIIIFVTSLVAQGFILFAWIPRGAACELMGFANRMKHEFPINEMRESAKQLRQQYHSGNLKVHEDTNDDHFVAAFSAVVVDDTELPTSLRGRFQRVFIQTNSLAGVEQVVFALGYEKGIICDDRKDARDLFVYTIDDGVHAYRYRRL